MKVKVNVQVEVLINTSSKKKVRFITDVKLPVQPLNWEGDHSTYYTNNFIARGVRKEWEPFVERYGNSYYRVHETMLFPEQAGGINYLDLECRNNSMTAHLALLAAHYPNHEFVYDLSNVPGDYFKERSW